MNIRNLLIILLAMTLMSGCQRKEKEAEIVFSEAVHALENGDFDTAEKNFLVIATDYPKTKTFLNMQKKKAEVVSRYAKQSYPTRTDSELTGPFSRQAYKAILEYKIKHNHYPKHLSDVDKTAMVSGVPALKNERDVEKYMKSCVYNRAPFDAGFFLDCKYAEHVMRKRGLTVRKPEPKPLDVKALYDFPQANVTWNDKLNPNNLIPADGFSAFYFDSNEPNKVLRQQNVPHISIDYSWDEFLGIRSEDFGGFWVGYLQVNVPTVYTIDVDKSWSQARIMIDNYIILEKGKHSKKINILLQPGRHLVEVEYLNHWHTTDFSVNFIKKEVRQTKQAVETSISQLKRTYPNLVGWYAGVYESKNRDLTVTMSETKHPVILFLSSYEAVNWTINNLGNTHIVAVVYGSHEKDSTVDMQNVDIFSYGRRLGSDDEIPDGCHCTAGNFHCSSDGSIVETVNTIKDRFGVDIKGFSVAYSSEHLIVPMTILDNQYKAQHAQNMQKIEQDKQTCKKKNNADFETVFQ